MTIAVPFDDSELSKAALHRSTELRRSSEEIVAVSVIPDGNTTYGRERGWLTDREAFDLDTIVSRLSEAVADRSPEASFDYVVTGQYANAGQIANEIRRYTKEAGARVVVIGSENAGRITATVGSIGRAVTTDQAYDVYIVRNPDSQ
jgi:nucleotide-binding universal stress UspA family protein